MTASATKPAPIDAAELLTQARAFVFHLLPAEPDDEVREREIIMVVWRGPGDRWAISDRGNVLNRQGRWEYEPLPSSRTEAFRRRTRFPRDEAIHPALAFLRTEQAEIVDAGFALDADGFVAHRSARIAVKCADPQATANFRVKLRPRDRAAFDRYLDNERCPSCQGREWVAVQGFGGTDTGNDADVTMCYLRVPCGCTAKRTQLIDRCAAP
jgi:hypothetical protein